MYENDTKNILEKYNCICVDMEYDHLSKFEPLVYQNNKDIFFISDISIYGYIVDPIQIYDKQCFILYKSFFENVFKINGTIAKECDVVSRGELKVNFPYMISSYKRNFQRRVEYKIVFPRLSKNEKAKILLKI